MTNKSEPAFPSTNQYFPEDVNYNQNCGLTKREYFAAMAMQGMLANGNHIAIIKDLSTIDDVNRHITRGAIRIADVLIEELER